MIPHRARGLQILHCILQIAAASALFWLWTLVVFNGFTGTTLVAYHHYFFYWLLVAVGLVIDNLRSNDLKEDFLNLGFIHLCAISFRQTTTVLVVLLLFLVGAKDLAISRTFLFSFIPPLFFLFLYSNRIFPRFLAKFVFSGRYVQNTILLGPVGPALRMNTWLGRKTSYGVRPVGLVTDDAFTDNPDCTLPWLGSTEHLEKHIRCVSASQVIAVGLPSSTELINSLADKCQRMGVRLLIANDFEVTLGRRITLVEDDGIHFFGFHREPLESPFNRILKRALDLMIAIPAVIFVLPVTNVLVWVLHRWQSPGPLFFRQHRTGMRDRDFLIYKYRTMGVNNPNEARQAQQNDERVFPAGRWLRKLSIDEIPQFINVLKGEMSVVGPRPHLRAHDELFKQTMNSYGVRVFIKPGITGLAQVRDFRGETKTERDVVDRVQSDLDYMENWSFLLDSMIILRTIWKVIFPPKASY